MILTYDIPNIPDPTRHRLTSLCGGDVREQIFRAHEHLLRTITSFPEGQVTLAIRYQFQPAVAGSPQDRLRLQLAVKLGVELSGNVAKQLVDAGPLGDFYKLKACTQGDPVLGFGPEFSSICEVVRLEEGIQRQVSRAENDRIPALYYAVYPFEAQEDNDALTMDRLLSKVDGSCAVEMLVRPVDQTPDLAAHYAYITHLASVNGYDDFSWAGSGQDSDPWSDEQPGVRTLTRNRTKDAIADEIQREHQEIHRNLRKPQLLFHIKTFATQPEHALMLASAVAESGLKSGKYRLIPYQSGGNETEGALVRKSRQESEAMPVSLGAMYAPVWRRQLPENWRSLSRLCRLATVDELKGLMRFPVGGYGSPRCIRKATDPKAVSDPAAIVIGDDLEASSPPDRVAPDDLSQWFEHDKPRGPEIRLPLKVLTKHMFVAGVPGSGKTTAVFNILFQLFRRGVPFLVIEPAKTEYRILKTIRTHPDPDVRQMAEQIRVYTPGNDDISPLHFNPLAFPEGISLDEHIGQVLASFEAAMPMGGPLQALLAEAVEAVYEGRAEGEFPMMRDLVEAARRILSTKSYEGEVRSNLQAAIEVRLGLLTRRAMGRLFECSESIPAVAELLSHPTIIAMDYLTPEHACLLTLLLLSAAREQIRIDPRRRTGGLHHVTVIEEAHNIVGRAGDAKASEEVADPKAFAARYVARMLAELRALGEGMIIADQLPSAVAPEVVKNTGTKLANRLVANDDREQLGGAMLLGPTEMEELARLSPGEGYFYSEGLYRPRRVRCLNTNDYLHLGDSPTGAQIIPHFAGDSWFIDAAETRLLMTLTTVGTESHKLMDAVQAARTRFKAIVPDQINRANRIEDPLSRRDELNEVYAMLTDLRDDLLRRVAGFRERRCQPLVLTLERAPAKFETVQALWASLCDGFNRKIVDPASELETAVNSALESVRTLLEAA